MKKLLSLAVLLLITVGICCTAAEPAAQGDQVTMEILDSTISYIKANHPDAAAFMPEDLALTLSSSTGKDIEGYTGVIYSGGGWLISMGHAIVPHYAWGIKADYDNGKIVWIGTSRNGQITEESYTKSN